MLPCEPRWPVYKAFRQQIGPAQQCDRQPVWSDRAGRHQRAGSAYLHYRRDSGRQPSNIYKKAFLRRMKGTCNETRATLLPAMILS